MTPFSPSNTVFTCSVAGSIVITISASLTASKIFFEVKIIGLRIILMVKCVGIIKWKILENN